MTCSNCVDGRCEANEGGHLRVWECEECTGRDIHPADLECPAGGPHIWAREDPRDIGHRFGIATRNPRWYCDNCGITAPERGGGL